MKTRIITLLLAISAIIIGGATAQQYDRKMDLYKNGTVVKSYDITDVDSLKFRRIDYVKAEYKVLPSGTGNVTIDGSTTTPKYVVPGTNVTYVATAKSGYKFKGWNMEGIEISTSNTLILPINSNTEITAVFQNIPNYSVTVVSSGNGTAVASKSSVQEGGSVTLTATPNSGYVFKNWTLNGNVVSTQNPYTATVTANSVYVANFKVAEKYRIKDLGTGYYLNAGNYTAHTDGPIGGVNLVAYAESADQIFTFTQSGSNYILTTKSGYNIVCQRWNVDALTSAGTALTFVDNGNGTYYIMKGTSYFKVEEVDGVYYPYCNAPSSMKATWILEQVGEDVTYTILVSSGEGGTATASKSSVQGGGSVTLTATPNSGYVFKNWTLNGNVVSTQNPYTATVTANSVYVANFEKTYTISVSSGGGGTAVASKSSVQGGGSVTLTATPNSGYVFKNWTLNGNVVSTQNPYTATVTANSVYVANFKGAEEYRIKDLGTGYYLNAGNYTAHTDGPVGGVNLVAYAESDDQIFTFTQSGSNYILTTKSGYNIVCQPWNVDALTSAGTALTFVDNGNRTYYIMNGSDYFKVDEVDGVYYPYCDAPSSMQATWILEQVGGAVNYTISVSSGGGGTAVASKSSVQGGGSVTLTATPNSGYVFKNWTLNGNVVSIQTPYTAIVTANSEYVANFVEKTVPTTGTNNGHAYVDLGLSVKWATCNVGATTPEEYGDYFAWGETTPKTTYDLSTYKYCNGTYDSMTKYCIDSDYGIVDNKTTLELTDDAAHVNWGGSWRMPTYEELSELMNINNCTWTWTTQNGVEGYKVTSKKNGNSIFLPAAGYRYNSDLCHAGNYGHYWSSSLNASSGAYYLDFYSSEVDRDYYSRYYGLSVRAVCE